MDLTSDDSVWEAFERVRYAYGDRIACVVHLAAYYDFSGEPSPLYDKITVRGTERLLRGLQGFRVGQFVFSSTMLVHAPTEPGRPINEDGPLEPAQVARKQPPASRNWLGRLVGRKDRPATAPAAASAHGATRTIAAASVARGSQTGLAARDARNIPASPARRTPPSEGPVGSRKEPGR